MTWLLLGAVAWLIPALLALALAAAAGRADRDLAAMHDEVQR